MLTIALILAIAAAFWFVVYGVRSSSLGNMTKEVITIAAAIVGIILLAIVIF